MSTVLNPDRRTTHRDADDGPLALRCTGLRKEFGTVVAVVDASLSVRRGETLALLGPSGCGKTTLLRLIAGFEAPDAGTVAITDRTVVGPDRFVPPERRRVGMVFQDYSLFPHLTLAENVRYGLSGPQGAPPREPAGRLARVARAARAFLLQRAGMRRAPLPPRVRTVLDLVALTPLTNRYPHELSGGEAQRAALARALAPSPDLILLDEPFSNLDTPLRAAIRAEVRQILERAGASAIFVTHDQEEAFSLADRVAMMWEGRIVQVAAPRDLYRHPATRAVAEFVGQADFLPGRIVDDRVETEIGALPLPRPPLPSDGAVDVMLRPERIQVLPASDGTDVAQVVSHEYYGHDQMITVRLASGRRLHVRLGPDDQFRAGDRVRLRLTGELVLFASSQQT